MFFLMMLVECLSTGSTFQQLVVDFDQECQEYLKFEGVEEYVYLFKEKQLTLMISQNTSYKVFTYPIPEKFTFYWPENKVDDQSMNLQWDVGSIGKLNFSTYHFLCPPTYFTTERVTDPSCLTYKCPKRNNNWLIVSIGLFLFIIIYGSGTAAQVISENLIPRIVRWSEQILSRSEEEPPEDYSEPDQRVSEDSITIHFTQTPE